MSGKYPLRRIALTGIRPTALMRGKQTRDGYEAGCQALRQALEQESRPHLQAFLHAWNGVSP